MYNQRYNQFYSTGQVFWPFIFQMENISGKLGFPSFLNLGLKEQHFNRPRKSVRSLCLHLHLDSLSQTFQKTDIHLRSQWSDMQLWLSKRYINTLLDFDAGTKLVDMRKPPSSQLQWRIFFKQI